MKQELKILPVDIKRVVIVNGVETLEEFSVLKECLYTYDETKYASVDDAISAHENYQAQFKIRQNEFNTNPTPEAKTAFTAWLEQQVGNSGYEYAEFIRVCGHRKQKNVRAFWRFLTPYFTINE